MAFSVITAYIKVDLINMLHFIEVLFFTVTYISTITSAKLYTTNLTDLSKCETHYSRSGSVYKDFYQLSKLSGDDNLQLDFHFSVLAPSDAHILLATSKDIEKDDPAYEIVIGAGGNTFCDIRRKQKSEVKASTRIKGMLSALDPSSFWLHMTKDGEISVGKEGEELPFLTWTDPNPFIPKVISFSTWPGIEAKWYFDCQRKEEIQKPLTYIEKLRQDILLHYSPYVQVTRTVSMALEINHLKLDEYEATVEAKGVVTLMWCDEKLRWNPANYSDIEAVHLFSEEIWTPDIILYNTANNGMNILTESLAVLRSTGEIEWKPAIYLKAWCDINDIKNWPADSSLCNLILNVQNPGVEIVYDKNVTSVVLQKSALWEVLEVNIYEKSLKNVLPNSGSVEVTVLFKRKSDVYNTIWFTPFLIISISILASHWVEPSSKLKLSICCAQLILTVIILLTLAVFIPHNTERIPKLVLIYSFTLLAIVVSMAVAVLVINISGNKTNVLPRSMQSILTSKVAGLALCLPINEITNHYRQIKQASSKQYSKHQNLTWILLGVTIDRIFFIIYLSLTLYVIYAH